MDTQAHPDTLIRVRRVLERTSFSRSALYREIAAGRFPAQVKIGRQAVAWSARDVDAWIQERADQARQRRAAILGRRDTPTTPAQQDSPG